MTEAQISRITSRRRPRWLTAVVLVAGTLAFAAIATSISPGRAHAADAQPVVEYENAGGAGAEASASGEVTFYARCTSSGGCNFTVNGVRGKIANGSRPMLVRWFDHWEFYVVGTDRAVWHYKGVWTKWYSMGGRNVKDMNNADVTGTNNPRISVWLTNNDVWCATWYPDASWIWADC